MRQSITKLASIAFIGGLIGRGLRYGLNIVIARGLGAEALGLFAFGMVVMKAVGLFARVGLDNAAQKYIPIYREESAARVSGIALLCLGTPLLIGAVLAIGVHYHASLLSRFTSAEFGRVAQGFALGIPLFAAMMAGVSATKGLKETKYAVYIRDFGQSIAAIVFVAVGAYFFNDLQAAVFGYVLSFAIGVGLAIVFLVREGAIRLDLRPVFNAREIFTYSLPLTITAFTQYILTWTDIIVLSAFASATVVGWYQAAYQTSVLLIVVLTSASAIFPAVAAELYNNGEYDRLGRVYTSTTKWITYVTLLGFVFIAVFAAEVLAIFDIAAREAQLALIIVGVGQLIVSSVGPVGYLLTMTEYERLYVVNTTVVATLNIVLNLLLVPEFGIIGAAAATAASFIVLNLLTVAQVWYLLGIQPYSRRYWKGFAAIAGTLPVMFAGQQLPIGGPAKLVLVGLASFCVFIGIVWAVGFDDVDRTLFESVQ